MDAPNFSDQLQRLRRLEQQEGIYAVARLLEAVLTNLATAGSEDEVAQFLSGALDVEGVR